MLSISAFLSWVFGFLSLGVFFSPWHLGFFKFFFIFCRAKIFSKNVVLLLTPKWPQLVFSSEQLFHDLRGVNWRHKFSLKESKNFDYIFLGVLTSLNISPVICHQRLTEKRQIKFTDVEMLNFFKLATMPIFLPLSPLPSFHPHPTQPIRDDQEFSKKFAV